MKHYRGKPRSGAESLAQGASPGNRIDSKHSRPSAYALGYFLTPFRGVASAVASPVLFFLLLITPCFAQEVVPWEVFGGYSFQRADVREYFISRSVPIIYSPRHHYVNMNGWEFSVTENVNRWFGGTLEISGYYKAPTIGSVTTKDHIYTILYGPRFTFPKAGGKAAPARLISASVPFAHILFGGAQTSATVGPPGPHASDFSFAMAIGGGLDWPLTPNVDLRVVQLDYLRTNALATSQNNYRASAGIVLRLGKPK